MPRATVATRLRQVFWVYLRHNFTLEPQSEIRATRLDGCELEPVTIANVHRVAEFRSPDREADYRSKLARRERGFFAALGGVMVGSIWATLNSGGEPTVVRSYMPLLPGEALVHDIVTGERYRGLGVGAFMVGCIVRDLFGECGARRVIVDVNVRNRRSLRMMTRAGLRPSETVLYVSAFGTLLCHGALRRHAG